jgi:hypothetical protein
MVRLEEPPGELGPSYVLTWINSGGPDDSVAERTIRDVIYLDAKNEPVVHTPMQEGLLGTRGRRLVQSAQQPARR